MTTTLAPRDVQSRLANSDNATVYLEPGDLDDAAVAALLTHEVPIHAERDYVRLKWAVRKATDDEVIQSQAFAQASSGGSTPSGVTAPEQGTPTTQTQPVGTTPSTPGASSPVAGVTTSSADVPDPDDDDTSSSSKSSKAKS